MLHISTRPDRMSRDWTDPEYWEIEVGCKQCYSNNGKLKLYALRYFQ